LNSYSKYKLLKLKQFIFNNLNTFSILNVHQELPWRYDRKRNLVYWEQDGKGIESAVFCAVEYDDRPDYEKLQWTCDIHLGKTGYGKRY
jgi:hypothetical protein